MREAAFRRRAHAELRLAADAVCAEAISACRRYESALFPMTEVIG
jgi:hypothetical protein